jgi:stress-induced morphogen
MASSHTVPSSAAAGGPVQQLIAERITAALAPVHLEIENESHKHSVPPGSESHFKLLVVSDKFDGVPLLARHRLVQDAVKGGAAELPVHALSIQAKAPSQWAGGTGAQLHETPNCRGGAGR